MLHMKGEELGETVILRCAGRIVRGEETSLLCAAVRLRGRDVIVDLSEVDALDAAGVGALISLQAAGIYLQLMNPTRAVREVLQVTGMDSVFEILDSPPEDRDKEGEHSTSQVRTLLPPLADVEPTRGQDCPR